VGRRGGAGKRTRLCFSSSQKFKVERGSRFAQTCRFGCPSKHASLLSTYLTTSTPRLLDSLLEKRRRAFLPGLLVAALFIPSSKQAISHQPSAINQPIPLVHSFSLLLSSESFSPLFPPLLSAPSCKSVMVGPKTIFAPLPTHRDS
jgi:hypothetical protein